MEYFEEKGYTIPKRELKPINMKKEQYKNKQYFL